MFMKELVDIVKIVDSLKDIKQWEKWEPFKYEDFTEEQLNSLKWEKWEPWLRWPLWPRWSFSDLSKEERDALTLKFWHLTEEDKDELRLRWEHLTQEQIESLKLRFKHLTDADKQELRLKFEDLTEANKKEIKGDKGDSLKFSDLTKAQKKELEWKKWDKWDKGDDWLSAYELAVKAWFKWTETQWLASLKGKDWKDGKSIQVTQQALKKHEHATTDINWLQEYVQDIIGNDIIGWTWIVVTYNDLTWETTINSEGWAADHGLLTGLSDDDHTQYHNDSRWDARYYTKTQLDWGQLDSRYYTETQVDTLLWGKQDTLVSWTNIKTINWNSILWAWDLVFWWWWASSLEVTQTWHWFVTTDWLYFDDADSTYKKAQSNAEATLWAWHVVEVVDANTLKIAKDWVHTIANALAVWEYVLSPDTAWWYTQTIPWNLWDFILYGMEVVSATEISFYTVPAIRVEDSVDYVQSVVAWTWITVDNTDPLNPIINATWGGTGTVTSVAVSWSDWIEVDSGSPVTTNGTIALWVNKTAMLSHLNVEDGADVTDATNVAAAWAFMKAVDDTDDITVGATNKFATAAEKTKLWYITVTQAVDLDTMESDIAGKQPLDSDLTTIAWLTATSDNFMQAKAWAWASRTVAQVKTDLWLTWTNSWDQTTIVWITGTKAEFNTAVTDGNFLYVWDVTQYTDELAQDAVWAMIDWSLTYVDWTPLLQRAALTWAITASAWSNTTALGSFSTAQLNTALSDNDVATGWGTATWTNTWDQNLFSTIAVSWQSNVVADSTSDTLTLVAWTNVTITTDAATDTITINASGWWGWGITWNEVTWTSQTAAVDNWYITNNAGLVTVTLPSTATVGQIVRIAWKWAGLRKVAQNSWQTIHFGVIDSTTWTSGWLESTERYDSVELLCITANTDWVVVSSLWNIDVI